MPSGIKVLPFPVFSESDLYESISSFDCGDEDLNDFFMNEAEQYHQAKLASTHVLCSDSDIVGFFTLVTDCLHRQRVEPDDSVAYFAHQKYPAVKIARLAVNLPYQNQGIGSRSLKWIFKNLLRFSDLAAFRFVTVDAKNIGSVPAFYKKFGFHEVPNNKNTDTVPMYIDYLSIYRYVKERL